MSINKNISNRSKLLQHERPKHIFDLLIKIQQGNWPSILADISCIPNKFDGCMLLYKSEELYVFKGLSASVTKELDICTKENDVTLKFEDIGTSSLTYDTFLIHRLKNGNLLIVPKVRRTMKLFSIIEEHVHAANIYIKLEDLLSQESNVNSVYSITDVRYIQDKVGTTDDNKHRPKLTETMCCSKITSLKKHKKVTLPKSTEKLYPLYEKEQLNPDYPQQVSEEQRSSERSALAFSSGLSLPVVTDQASSVANEGIRFSAHNQRHLDPNLFYSARYPAYVQYNDRVQSYAGWTHRDPDSVKLSRAGFFYTKAGDLVRCFHCGIGLKDFSEGDDPLKEHVKHSERCLFLIQLIGESRLKEWKSQLQNHDPEHYRQMQLRGQKYKNVRYKHPEYQTLEARLNTFITWPAHMTQRPEQLAEAGLYYTGVDDCVRCFACDGGLRRWDADDDPWTEHCRWFPSCPFAKETKGDEFIALIQTAVALENEESEANNSNSPSSQLNLVGEMEQMTLRDPELRAALNEHKEACLEMGFQLEEFNEAVQELRNRGTIKPTIEEIVDVIDVILTRKREESALKARINETPIEENQRLKSLLTCIACEKNSVNALLLPCTHHHLCMKCAEPLSRCPVCDKEIRQKIRTYMV